MSDTLVFIPAWNEEQNLSAVLDELFGELPDVDVLVVDDGSTDGTVAVARAHGAEVLSFGENRGLRAGIAAGYSWALERGYAYCGRVDADGQHPASELRRLLEIVRSGEADVAVGSRFVSGPGYEPYRFTPEGIRKLGTGLLRRSIRAALGRPFSDATSGLYAASAKALPALSRPYESGAPEVEAVLRLHDEGLRVAEVPVDMRERAGGESKLKGKKAFMLVLTVIGTLIGARRFWRRGWARCRARVLDGAARQRAPPDLHGEAGDGGTRRRGRDQAGRHRSRARDLVVARAGAPGCSSALRSARL